MADWDVSINPHARTVILPQLLDIKAAISLTEGILSMRGAEIVIDASRVERLGAQSLQILLSAVSTWHADGMSFEFVRPSQAFVESLRLFGIDADALLSGNPRPFEGESQLH